MLSALLVLLVAVATVAPAPAGARSPTLGRSMTVPVAVEAPATDARAPAMWVPPLRMPMAGTMVRGFEAPAGPYGPGHRGIDLAAAVGERVGAPAAGRVVFAGPVAGRVWVSLLVAPGVVVTVGPLLDPVASGRRVRALDPVGRLGPGHDGTLHLSLRVDGVYLDPLSYLVDRPRPRLAPLPEPGGRSGPARREA